MFSAISFSISVSGDFLDLALRDVLRIEYSADLATVATSGVDGKFGSGLIWSLVLSGDLVIGELLLISETCCLSSDTEDISGED